jgi:hypothetical protein
MVVPPINTSTSSPPGAPTCASRISLTCPTKLWLIKMDFWLLTEHCNSWSKHVKRDAWNFQLPPCHLLVKINNANVCTQLRLSPIRSTLLPRTGKSPQFRHTTTSTPDGIETCNYIQGDMGLNLIYIDMMLELMCRIRYRAKFNKVHTWYS